ncbi:MAG: YceD family protein [bacterium]
MVEALASDASEVQLTLEFRKGKKQKTLVIGNAKATVGLMCQKCLAVTDFDLNVSFRHLVVTDDEALLDLPDEVEGIVCPDDKIRLVDLFEDELILNLPMVAKHDADECEPMFEHQNDDSNVKSGTHRPFANLAELKNELKGASDGCSKK